MDRRDFLQTAAVSTLAAQGYLPLLAAEGKGKNKKKAKKDVYTHSSNIYTEPTAIESITGYLPKYKPVVAGAMDKPFAAKYLLINCSGSAVKSKNHVGGSIDVAFSNGACSTTEVRKGKPFGSSVKTEVKFGGKFNTVSSWTLDSSVEGVPDTRFVEKGTWDGKTMVVKSKSWTQKSSTSNPLIGRWALLGLLSSGKLKPKPLTFDMLDDSTLRNDQTIRYTGQIEIPVSGGTAKLDSYAQTGSGIVPTHYLVDAEGRVQLITMSAVNWALSGLG